VETGARGERGRGTARVVHQHEVRRREKWAGGGVGRGVHVQLNCRLEQKRRHRSARRELKGVMPPRGGRVDGGVLDTHAQIGSAHFACPWAACGRPGRGAFALVEATNKRSKVLIVVRCFPTTCRILSYVSLHVKGSTSPQHPLRARPPTRRMLSPRTARSRPQGRDLKLLLRRNLGGYN
jgi:hypothetical protein